MNGIIEGGWEFVWAAYGLSLAVLAGYTISLFVRLRQEYNRTGKEARFLDDRTR